MDKINNKNAREKALLEEAYGSVYKENFNPRRDAPSHKRGDPHPATRAAEDIVDREVMWDRKSGVVDEVDVERGFAWVITDDDGGLHEVELGNFDHIGDKREREDEENPNADTYDKQGEEPAEMVSLNRNEEEEYTAEHHDKFVKIAHEALGMIADELHVGEYQEAFNIIELTDGHNQLSAALIALLGEKQAKDIMGGQAARQAAAGSQPEQFTPMEFPSDEEY